MSETDVDVWFDQLDQNLGYKDTSREAWKKSAQRASGMRSKILVFLGDRGALGGTDEEMDTAFNTAATRSNRPTRLSLVEDGLVRASGERRLTASLSQAIVWELTPDDEIDVQKTSMRVRGLRKEIKKRMGNLNIDRLNQLSNILDDWEASGF
jgi:hypothetical protein